jgi:putative redox protein
MASSITIRNIPVGYQTIISNGRHSLLADEPVSSRGTDLGLSPTDLLLSSLGMCKAATVRFIARKKGWAVGDVHAELAQTVKRDAGGTLATHVTVAMRIEGDITDEQRRELLKEADACYVHRMIEGSWSIEPAEDARY